MSLTTSDFWKRLRQSKLLEVSQLEALRVEFSTRPDVQPNVWAAWCVSKEFLTEFQARQLLQRSGRFVYGNYVITSPADQRHWKGWFRATDRQSGTAVFLKPLAGNATAADLEHERKTCAPQNVRVGLDKEQEYLIAWPRTPPAPPIQRSRQDRSTASPWRRGFPPALRRPAAVAGLGLLLLIAVVTGLVWRGRPPTLSPQSDASTSAEPLRSADAAPDSGRLWARPREGQPVALDYLPNDVQAVLRIQLAAIVRHTEGDRILRGLGPNLRQTSRDWLRQWGLVEADVESIMLGLLPQGTTVPQTVWVLTLETNRKRESLEELAAASPAGEVTMWFPESEKPLVVLGSQQVVNEIRELGARPMRLRRELAHLHTRTHDTDHLTILANPNFLNDEAQAIFSGSRRRLLRGLIGFWGDHAQAVSLGVQLSDDVALVEFRIIAREDWAPRRLLAHVDRQIQGLAGRVTDFLGRIHLDHYWQPLALRFPEMLRFVAEQTRLTTEGRQAVASVALPVEAIHNLLLATELAVASPLRTVDAQEEDRSEWSIVDVLAAHTSIRIAQQSLEFSAQDIVRQVRDEFIGLPFVFSIEILGADLEPQGITRNQQIRDFHHDDRPLQEILTALVMKANPIQNISDPTDLQQHLVWVVSPTDPSKVVITTRTAAHQRGWDLPDDFEAD